MGIPLPALSVRPPQEQDVTADVGRLVALKSMLGQQQMQQQEIALKQQQVKDQQTVMSYLQKNPTSSFGDAANALKGQISLPAYSNLIDTDAQIRQKHAAATDAELKNSQGVHDQQQRIYDNAANLSDEDLAKQWPTIAQEFNNIPGNTVKVDPSQPISKRQLQQYGTSLALQEGYLKQEADKRKAAAETTEATQKGEEAATAAAKNRAEMEGFVGPFAEAKYRNILSAISAGKPVSDDDLTFAKGFEAASAKTTTQSDTLGVTSTNMSKPAGLAAVGNRQGGRFVAPGANGGTAAPTAGAGATSSQGIKQSIVDLIGQYKMNPQLLSRMMYKHPEMVGLVHEKYPDWDQTDYQAKNKIVDSYTSGPESKSINAISTALGHAGELGQAIEALNNGDTGLKFLRNLGNKIGVQTGGDAVTTFNTIVHRLAPEITAAYVQGGGGEGERAANAEDFNPALGGKQLRSNLSETIKLLRSKIAAQEQQWNNTYKPTRPEDDFSTRFLTPQAKDALRKYSPQSATIPPNAKVLTQAQLAQAAKDHNVSVEEATRQAKAAGYTVQ